MTKKFLAVIPSRGGSKGLPGKNKRNLAGKPLVAWTIEASLNSQYITKTVVSSDDKEILHIAEQYGATPMMRPAKLADDKALTESVAKHTLNQLLSNGEVYDVLIVMQPTSPLRTSHDIDKAVEIMLDADATAVISVFENDNKILKAFKRDSNGYLEGIANNEYPFMRRQDLPKTFMPNGAIFIVKVDLFQAYGRYLTDRTVCYVMPADLSVDIDTVEDLGAAADMLMAREGKAGFHCE